MHQNYHDKVVTDLILENQRFVGRFLLAGNLTTITFSRNLGGQNKSADRNVFELGFYADEVGRTKSERN